MNMTPWFETAAAKYGWIWIGLLFGFTAKYALLIKRGVKIRPMLVVADIMLLPMVALIAYWLVTKAGIDGEAAALSTAAATVGADRIVKLYTDRFVRQIDMLLADEAGRTMKTIAEGTRPAGDEK
jgi:hypothetical protein